MAKYTSVLHQLLRHVPRDEFRAIVGRHQGDKGVRKLSCWGQFVALFFGQLTGQHSLREVHPVNGEVPPVKGRPWKLPHYANRGKTSSSGGELASARSCFSTVRTALGKLRITGLLARFDVARSFPQFPRPLLLQPTIWTSERGADLGSGRCQPRPHLPIYRMTLEGSDNHFRCREKEAAASGAGSGEPLHAGRCEPQTAPGDLRGAVLLPVPALSPSGSRAAFRLPASGLQSGCDGDRSVPESL